MRSLQQLSTKTKKNNKMKKLLIALLLTLSFTAQSQDVTLSKSKNGRVVYFAMIYNINEASYYLQYCNLDHHNFFSYERLKIPNLDKFKTDLSSIFVADENLIKIIVDENTIIEVSKFRHQLYRYANCKVISYGKVVGLFSINKRDIQKLFS